MPGAGGEVTWAATGISGAAPRGYDEIDQHLPTLPIWGGTVRHLQHRGK